MLETLLQRFRLKPATQAPAWPPAILLTFLAVVTVLGFGIRLAETERRIAIDRAEGANQTTARLVAEQMFSIFRTSDAVLDGSLEPLTGPPVDLNRFNAADVRSLIATFGEISYVFLGNRAGKPVAATFDGPLPAGDYSDRLFFRSHLDGADLTFNAPHLSQRTGQWVVPVSKAVRDAKGQLHGVLVGAVAVAYLEKLLASAVADPLESATLYRADGTVLATWPAGDSATRPVAGQLWQNLDDSHPVLRTVVAANDGDESLTALAKITRYPLVIAVSRSRAAALAAWWRSTLQMGFAAVLFSAVLLGLAILDRNRVRQLQYSEQTLELITETVNEAFWVGGPEQPSILYLSPAYEKIWRRPRAPLYTESSAFIDTIHPEDRRRVGRDIAQCRSRGLPFEHQFRILRPDGSQRRIWGRGFPIKDNDGKLIRLVGVMQDITERAQAEDDLKRAKQFLDKVVNAAPDPIFVKDRDHRWIMVNDAMCTLVGVERQRALFKSDFDFFPENEAQIFWQTDEAVFSSKAENVNEETITDSSGRVHILVTKKSPFTDIDGNAFLVGTVRDITQAKQAEQAINDARQAAELASRAKSEFLANMSHEIRTPMNAILGLARLLEESPLSSQEKDYVRQIGISAQLLLGILSDILDFSRIEAGRLELECVAFSLPDVIKNIVEVISLSAREKNLTLSCAIDDDVPSTLFGDPLRLTQILLNLLGNAVKFTDAGEVNLRISTDSQAGDRMTLRFCVQDTGIGIAADRQDQLFQAFTQGDSSTSRKYGGSGLGLAIAGKLVSLMGGAMDLTSRPGEGSRFSFTAGFDIGDPAFLNRGEERRPPPLAGRLEGFRLLLVEDNDVNQAVARQILTRAGAAVEIAGDGAQAVAILSDRGRSFDAVLMDIQMPGMDGYEATRVIRHQLGLTALPIIAMTANAMAGDRRKSMAAGMNAHIAKPIDVELLFRTLGARPRDAAPVGAE